MSQMDDPNDPEVQRNGFEVILEAINVAPDAMRDWFEGTSPDDFDPTATWDENLRRFRAHLESAQGVLNGADADAVDRLLDDEEAAEER